MSLRSGFPVVITLVLLTAAITLAPPLFSAGIVPRQHNPRAVHLASTATLGYAGVGPNTISLNWTQSSDTSFQAYVLQRYSTLLSGWETIANLLYRTNTTFFVSGQDANAIGLWQITYQNTTGFQNSNTLSVTQPSVASLSYSQPTSTSMLLQWNNNAKYGGLLHFSSYQVMESINGGTYFVRASYSSFDSLSYVVSGLSPSTNYSFYLNTTDECIGSGCPTGSLSSSLSKIVTISTPGALVAIAHASPVTLDVRELASFICTSGGGAPPYVYSWTFGDGSSGTGASPSHTYNAPGMMNVVCTVTDGFGNISDAKPIALPVYVDPSVKSFTLTPANSDLGERITFFVSTSGGNGSLTFSYTNLPAGCSSANSSSFSCIPTSSGTYDVTVTVTDQGQETANSTLRLSIAPPRVLGLPRTMLQALIFGAIFGICAVIILSAVLLLRRKGDVV